MWLRKDSGGGTTIQHEGEHYHFPAASPLCEVPAELGHILLHIAGAGYTEVPAPPKPAPAASKARRQHRSNRWHLHAGRTCTMNPASAR